MLSFSVQKQFPKFSLDVSLDVGNEIMVLLAPSGGGKTLTLNLISGIVKPDSGYVRLNGSVLYDSREMISLPIRKRGIGYIFQDYSLFPNKTVRENVSFGMHADKESATKVAVLLERFGLTEKGDAYPDMISGGQKQRTAIARALAAQPHVLLFDEPLSALDMQFRESLLQEIGSIPRVNALPVLYVTHNFREAEQLAGRIAVMNDGRLIETGNGDQIFKKPHKLFTATFTGVKNIFRCSLESRKGDTCSVSIFDRVRLEMKTGETVAGDREGWLGIHPQDVRLVVTDDYRPNVLTAHVEDMHITDRVYRVTLQVLEHAVPVNGFKLCMDIEELTCRKYKLSLNDVVRVSLKPERLFLCVP